MYALSISEKNMFTLTELYKYIENKLNYSANPHPHAATQMDKHIESIQSKNNNSPTYSIKFNNHQRSKKMIYDFIGIGFGPANLSLAVAIAETSHKLTYKFFERKNGFNWHPDMILQDAKMQTPFLKDLATLSNPQSRFTFINYLHQHNRLNDYINLRDFYPTRVEFNLYMQWAATQVKQHVLYQKDVVAINPIINEDGETVSQLSLHIRDNKSLVEEIIEAKNIVLGMGQIPHIPQNCTITNERSFHSEQFLTALSNKLPDKYAPYHIIVVGSGQSAAEIVGYLLSHYPHITVTAISTGFLYRSLDANPLTNSFYAPEATENFYHLNSNAKKNILNNFINSNYGVVDAEIINHIAKIIYDDLLINKTRLNRFSFHKCIKVDECADNVSVTCHNLLNDNKIEFKADAVFFATGYSNSNLHNLLNQLKQYFIYQDNSDYKINKNYKIATHDNFTAGIYLQNYSINSHGLTEGTIANIAGRSRIIYESLFNELDPINQMIQGEEHDYQSFIDQQNS